MGMGTLLVKKLVQKRELLLRASKTMQTYEGFSQRGDFLGLFSVHLFLSPKFESIEGLENWDR